MARWGELPDSLDEPVRQLVVQLRRLKDRGGFSLAALAERTSYSRSSWDRYLSGKKLAPREAVEELARLCSADSTRLLVLHEVAAQAWGGGAGMTGEARTGEARTGEARTGGTRTGGTRTGGTRTGEARVAEPGTTGPRITEPSIGDPGVAEPSTGEPWIAEPGTGQPGPAPRRTRSRRSQLLLTAGLGSAFAVVGLLGALVGPLEASASGDPEYRFAPGRTYGCEVGEDGRELRAGHSGTDSMLLGKHSMGWEVVEAQCLLGHHGYPPGPVDGAYGDRTEHSVRSFQRDHSLVVDGIVGPDTWAVLRR
ncbi:peptidoglycan-binding protein [Streptomyces sp. NA04227]|uniref:peptidoglycan-binding protein n=1 Tax=Streptomyces sp. NA04227 TaxID=2742136 RepID=UPI00159226CB|nr:peptidoglycan-binding protein [Streptomyces sp. NA04227]QKW07134.1 peptidoglycan-binding protein [Streptomyces sp. NA04227]